MRIRPIHKLLPAVLASLVGCSQPGAMGEANSLIVIAPDSLWAEVEQATYDVLEPTIFTTRDEKQYLVQAVDPTHPAYNELRLFRNVLVFGDDRNPLMEEVAAAGGVTLTDLQPGRVFQVADVWARNQTVTATVLRRGSEVESWIDALPSVLNAVDERYQRWVLERMFATPPDTALAAELGRRFGFEITVPQVYDRVARGTADGDSLVILRNDNPDPSQLIRSVLVAWRPTVDSMTAELALEWRAAIDSVHYNVAQAIDDSRSTVTSFQLEGRSALEVTGVWQDERGNFPAAGPFIVWLVDCPDRTYFIDAWLYAPNDPKYEYMLQLQEILASFRCDLTGQ